MEIIYTFPVSLNLWIQIENKKNFIEYFVGFFSFLFFSLIRKKIYNSSFGIILLPLHILCHYSQVHSDLE